MGNTQKSFEKLSSFFAPYLGISMPIVPVGTIVPSFSRSSVIPEQFLICNAQVLNIVDYPELAKVFEVDFGAVNYFGGDGVTTFKLPNLLGEFLRCFGANKRPYQGSGSSVGVHQDATRSRHVWGNNSTGLGFNVKNLASSTYIGFSESYDGTHNYGTRKSYMLGFPQEDFEYNSPVQWHNFRPPNTSVRYLICARTTYTSNTGGAVDYSLDEQEIGIWFDRRPVYQRTFVYSGVVTDQEVSLGVVSDADMCFIFDGYAVLGTAVGNAHLGAMVNLSFIGKNQTNPDAYLYAYVDTDSTIYCNVGSGVTVTQIICTVRYTKMVL